MKNGVLGLISIL